MPTLETRQIQGHDFYRRECDMDGCTNQFITSKSKKLFCCESHRLRHWRQIRKNELKVLIDAFSEKLEQVQPEKQKQPDTSDYFGTKVTPEDIADLRRRLGS